MDGLSTKSGVPVNEGKQQLLETKALASELRGEAQEHKKLGLIKGSHDLMEKIDEILEEIEEQSDKLMTTIQLSTTVFHNLQSLHASMLSVKDLFAEINKKSLFLSKRSLKTKMQNLYQTLRSKCTQLMTSVSLVLLTNRPVEEKPVIKLNSELYTLGIHYFYGLNGKPKNYTRAFEKFIQGAEYGDSDAMCMVSKCYLNGYGIEAHYDAGLEWLVKAINVGHSNYAKNELAMLIVERLKEKNENVLRDYFVNRDHIDYETAQNTPNVRNSNVGQSFNNKSKKLLRDVSNNSDLDDIDTDNGLLSSAFYERNNNNDEAKSVTDTQSNYGANALEVEEEVYDLDYAFKLLLEAATEEPAVESAKTNLGMFFEECGDIEQAAKWYSLASNGGCSKATCKLGMLFLNNGTVNANTMTNNRHKSYSMFKMSAMNGETDSFNGLGQCYETGIGCEIDLHTSLKWYLKGAHAGDKLAMYNYGYIKIKNALDVIDTMKKVKKHSKTYLFSHLHKQHEAHHIDDINDSHRNDTHYNPNAEEEGEYIIMGRRADESLQEGLHWLRAASENGVADAAFQIGRLYEQALGVPQDSTAALANYQHAAFLGHSQAALFAANLLYEQFKDNIHDDIVSIMDLYKQAALGGSPEAMNCLGILIEDGHRGLFDNTTYVRSEYAQVTDFYTACMWYYESCLHGLAGAFLNFAMLIATEEIYSFTTINGTLLTLAEAKKFIENKMAIGILNDNEKANRMGHLLLHMESMQQYAHNNNNVYNSSNKHNSTLVQHSNHTIHHNSLNINSSKNNINLSRNNSNSNISGINVPINLTLRAPNYNATNSINGSVQGSPHRKINNSTTITNQFNHNFALHNSLSTFQNVGHIQNRPHFAPKNDEFASLVLKTMPHSPSKAGNRYNTNNNPNYNSIDSVATTHNNTNNGNHLSVPKLNNSPKAHSNTNNVNSSWGQVDLKQINAFNKSPHTNTAGYNTHYQENFPVNFPANNKQNSNNNSQSEKNNNSNKPPLLTSKSYNGSAAQINNNNNSNSGNNSNTNQFTYAHNNNSNHNNNPVKNSYDHGTYRSGELYTTNGPIPPPNYVPKAAPVAAPSADTKARPQHANMLGGISSLGGNNINNSSGNYGNNTSNNGNHNSNSNNSRLNISTNDAVGSEVDGLHTPTLSNHNNNTNFAGFNAQQNLNNSTLGHYNSNQNRDNGNNSNTSNNSNLNSNNNSSNNSVHSVHFSSDINNTQNNTINNTNSNTYIHRNNSFNGSPPLGSSLASQKGPSAPGNSRSGTPTLINPANNSNNNSSNNNSNSNIASGANPSVGGVANTAVAKNRFMSFGSKKHKDDTSTAATTAANRNSNNNTNNNSNNNSRNNSTDNSAVAAPVTDDKTAHKPSMWKMGFGKSKSSKDNTTNNSTTGIASLDNSPHDTAGSNSPHTTVIQK